MTTLWMGYALLVALILGAAAHAAEKALRSGGRPGRWPWLAAMAGSWALGLHALLRPSGPTSSLGLAVGEADVGGIPGAHDGATGTGSIVETLLRLPGEMLESGAGLMAALPMSGLGGTLDGWIGPLWGASAAAAGLIMVAAVASLARRSRHWPEIRVQDQPVRVSPNFGPAVVGVLTPRIVLPRWALRLDGPALRLVLEHEGEHRRARDTLVLAAGALAAVAAPWNLPLWWQLRRLRLAVELDCDGRVMRRGATPREYGALLVEIGERFGRVGFPAAALAEGTSFLERRLRMITEARTRRFGWKSAGAAVLATGMVALACETPAPTDVAPPGPTPAASTLTERGGASSEAAGGTVERSGAPDFEAVQIPPDPLIVVDGVIHGEMKVADIHDLDVARVEVVKGEAGSFFEGRARNGLVRVTTREALAAEGAVAEYHVKEVPNPAGVVQRRALGTPLVVLDGVIDEGMTMEDLQALDPETIESIEVVKGEVARTIYGERGTKGVVIVRTKGSGG